MSYESSAWDEVRCDFPDRCSARFDDTPEARCAALRNSNIVAFCQEHSQVIIQRGVKLRTLDEVRAEYGRLPGIPSLEEDASRRMAKMLELDDFIASLR